METRNIRVLESNRDLLKLEAMKQGKTLQKLADEIIQDYFDRDRFKDEYGNPIDMRNHNQVFLDRFGGIIPADSEMDFREYVEFVLEYDGVLRPHIEEEGF